MCCGPARPGDARSATLPTALTRVDWRLAHDEDLVAYGTCKLVICGCSSEYKRDLRLKKEPGDTNVSDALTKPMDEKRIVNLLTLMGYEFRGGRTSLVPEAQ